MAETVKDIFLKVRALIDEYSEDGSLIPDDEVIDLQSKTIPLADMAQKELYSIGNLYKTFEFAHKPAPNLLGLMSNFNVIDFIGDDQFYPNEKGVVGAKAYYIEADGDGSGNATIEIQEEQSGVWTTIVTINPIQTLIPLTAFKGALSPISSTNPIRYKISGTTTFRHANRALYSYPFAESKVPDYRAWFKVEMPIDFRNVDQIINEVPTRQYQVDANYKFERNKDLYVNYYFEGNIRISYKPVPTTISGIDDILEIDDITSQAIVYYVAARLSPFENKELVQFFESKYLEIKNDNTNDIPRSEEQMVNLYGGNNSYSCSSYNNNSSRGCF